MKEIFPLHHRVQIDFGAHPAFYSVGNAGSYPGINSLGREADHSPPCSAAVKNV
jgi:hypothetical protein